MKKNKSNWYFREIFLPLNIAFTIIIVLIFLNIVQLNFYLIFITWFLIGPIGIGVGYHRLFSHRQFETYKIVEYILAVLGTLAGYAPLLFWASQHVHHHKVSDTKDDPSSPIHGFIVSTYSWRLWEHNLKKINIKNKNSIAIVKDKFLMFLSKKFKYILYTVFVILLMIDVSILANLFIIPMMIEHFRINIINYVGHTKLPFSYRNHNTNENSQNNLIFGLLTFGFGWHNNHHAHPGRLNLHEKWWEIDVEGLIGKLLSK